MAFVPPSVATEPEAEKLRLTPMEIDVQLQAAELVFRSLLEGKRPAICFPKEVDDWYAEVCGSDWLAKNTAQRDLVASQMKRDGELTPMWVEAAGHMADIAWEMLEVQNGGLERVRKFALIDRTEILELLRELYPKVRDSRFARCGAGERGFGLRALVAVLRVFERDPEVLEVAARCLTLIVTDNNYNRDALAELFVPMAEHRTADKKRGWSFLRAALNAFMLQAGAEGFPSPTPVGDDDEEEKEEEEPAVLKVDNVDREPRRDVAVCIAECIAATKDSPALVGQLKLLRHEMPQDAPRERQDLKQMLQPMRTKLEELTREESSPALQDLLEMLRIATQ